MKTKLFFLLAVFLLLGKINFAQIPTYTLKVDSMRLVDIPPYEDNAIEFGVYLTHTNAPTAFTLAGQQLFFSINPDILPPCTITDTSNCLKYRMIDSQLPVPYRPRNPTISTAASPSQTILRLAINACQSCHGLDITGLTDLLICKMRLTSIYGCFNNTHLGLAWRNPPVVSFSTKFFAYINNVNTDITTPGTHTIDSTGLNFVTFGCPGRYLKLTILNEGLYYPALDQMSRRDTFKVYLRNSLPPYSIVDSAKNVIDTINFTNRFIFRNASAGTYYIVAKHFNSIETWSKIGGEIFTEEDTTFYNFTTMITQAFGDNMKLKGSKYTIYSGDIGQDGTIDGSDFSAVYNDAIQFAQGIRLPTDLNADNIVDGSDYLIVNNNSFSYISVIRP